MNSYKEFSILSNTPYRVTYLIELSYPYAPCSLLRSSGKLQAPLVKL